MVFEKEFVQRSIIPDFILVPSLGGKVMMWQDLSILGEMAQRKVEEE